MFEPKTVHNVKILEGHIGAIYDVIYCNKQLFTSSADKFVVSWDLVEGKQAGFTVKLEQSAYNIAFSEKFKTLAIGTNNGNIHVIDTEKREEIRLMTQHKSSVFALTYCIHKEQFYSGDRDGYFCVWEAKTFDLLLIIPFDCGKIREIAVSENGEYVAVCGQDGIVRILESDFFNTISEFKTHEDGVNCAVFDGENLYTGGKDAYIKKWEWRNEKKILSVPAHNYAVYDLELIDNRKKLVSVSFDKSIKLWNANDISIIERIEYKNKGHRHTVNRIAKISEKSFATVGDDKKIKVWELM